MVRITARKLMLQPTGRERMFRPGLSQKSGQSWLNSRYSLKVEPTRFTDGLDMGK